MNGWSAKMVKIVKCADTVIQGNQTVLLGITLKSLHFLITVNNLQIIASICALNIIFKLHRTLEGSQMLSMNASLANHSSLESFHNLFCEKYSV